MTSRHNTPAAALALLAEHGFTACPLCLRDLGQASSAPAPSQQKPEEAPSPPRPLSARRELSSERDAFGVPLDALPVGCPRLEGYTSVMLPARLAATWRSKDETRVRLRSGRVYLLEAGGVARLDLEQPQPPEDASTFDVLPPEVAGELADALMRAAGSEVGAAIAARSVGYQAGWYLPVLNRDQKAIRWLRFADAGPLKGSRIAARKAALERPDMEGATVLLQSTELELPALPEVAPAGAGAARAA